MCSCDWSHSQYCTWLTWSASNRCSTLPKVILILIETSTVQNFPYLCLCYTSRPGISACTCTLASLHCWQSIFSILSLFTFCIHSWEGTNLPQSLCTLRDFIMCLNLSKKSQACVLCYKVVLKCSTMWNSAKRISVLVLHHSSPTICTAGTICKMHVGVFFISKRVRHFDYNHTATQHSQTNLDNVQAGTRSSYRSTSSLH
jgi:hypothetical protein